MESLVQEPTLLTTSPCGPSKFLRVLNATLRNLEFVLYLINQHLRSFIHKAERFRYRLMELGSVVGWWMGRKKSAFCPTKEAKGNERIWIFPDV